MAEPRLTFHMAPRDRWEGWPPDAPYASPSLAEEGFVHCTDGVANMVATANRFYRDDPGEFVVMTIDLERTGSPWRIDDAGKPFPHIYGTIDRAAILRVRPFPRDAEGAFVSFE